MVDRFKFVGVCSLALLPLEGFAAGPSVHVRRCLNRGASEVVSAKLPERLCIESISLEAPRYFEYGASGWVFGSAGSRKEVVFRPNGAVMQSNPMAARRAVATLAETESSASECDFVKESLFVEIDVSPSGDSLQFVQAYGLVETSPDRAHAKTAVTRVQYQ